MMEDLAAHEIVIFLAGGAVKAALLLGAAFVLSHLLTRASAGARHALWVGALAGALAIPLLSPWMPSWKLGLLRLPEAGPSERAAVAESAQRTRPSITYQPSAPRLETSVPPAVSTRPDQRAESPTSEASLAHPAGFASALLGLWLAGTVLLLGQQSVGLARARWLTRRGRSEPLRSSAWTSQVAAAAEHLGVRRPVKLLVSDAVSTPWTWGHRRPVILLPATASSWSDERRRVVLLHEMAHIRRGDWLIRCLAQVACAVYWFNPLAWTALRRLVLEQELACDERVLSEGTRPSAYASHLLAIARSSAAGVRSPLMALDMARRSQMEGRLMSILNYPASRPAKKRILSTLAILAALALTLAAVEPWTANAGPDPAANAEEPGDLRQILGELNRLEDRMRPFEDRMAAVEAKMEPYHSEMESVEEEMKPFEERLEAIEVDTEPFEERLEALQANLKPFEEQMKALEREMKPFADRMEKVSEGLEPFEGRGEEIEKALEPFEEMMESVHAQMEPLQHEMEELGRRLESAEPGERERLRADFEVLAKKMEPLHERLESIHREMAPHHERLQAIHQEMHPVHEQIEAIHEEMRPLHERLEAIHREMEPTHRQMESVHEEMGPIHRLMESVHEGMETFHHRMESFHQQMEPLHRQMEDIHQEMEPIHREMETLHRRLEGALEGEIRELLEREIGGAAGPGADFAKAAKAVASSSSVRVDDHHLRLMVSAPTLRGVLRKSLAVKNPDPGFEAAVDRAVRALTEFEVAVPGAASGNRSIDVSGLMRWSPDGTFRVTLPSEADNC